MRKAGADLLHPHIIEDDPVYVPAKGWAEMIRKVYEVDPLLCPSCGGRMRILSFIEEPKTIDRIIRHLELTFEAARPPPPHHVQHEFLMAADEGGEYFLRRLLGSLCQAALCYFQLLLALIDILSCHVIYSMTMGRGKIGA